MYNSVIINKILVIRKINKILVIRKIGKNEQLEFAKVNCFGSSFKLTNHNG